MLIKDLSEKGEDKQVTVASYKKHFKWMQWTCFYFTLYTAELHLELAWPPR